LPKFVLLRQQLCHIFPSYPYHQYQWWLGERAFSGPHVDSLSAAAKIYYPKKQYVKNGKKGWYTYNVNSNFSAEGAFG
jgi:hypothetical protein